MGLNINYIHLYTEKTYEEYEIYPYIVYCKNSVCIK